MKQTKISRSEYIYEIQYNKTREEKRYKKRQKKKNNDSSLNDTNFNITENILYSTELLKRCLPAFIVCLPFLL